MDTGVEAQKPAPSWKRQHEETQKRQRIRDKSDKTTGVCEADHYYYPEKTDEFTPLNPLLSETELLSQTVSSTVDILQECDSSDSLPTLVSLCQSVIDEHAADNDLHELIVYEESFRESSKESDVATESDDKSPCTVEMEHHVTSSLADDNEVVDNIDTDAPPQEEEDESVVAAKKLEEEKDVLMSVIAETENKFKERAQSRKKNANVDKIRPEESFFAGLDSSLKKNTAFVRKVKSFTSNQMSAILSDLRHLNLTKYTSEVASAIVEAKLKMSDVDAAVQLCLTFHQTYADFSGHLLDNWQKVLAIKKDDKNINSSKLRVDLRFYAECINYGVFTNKEGLPTLGNVLTVLIGMDKEEHNNINIILNFCRHCGDDFAALVPTRIRKLSEQLNVSIPRSELLPKEKQKNVRSLLKDYFTSLSKHYVKVHKELQLFQRQNKKILQTKGELSSERKAKQEKLESMLKRLKVGVEGFAEQLDEALPDLPEDESSKGDEGLSMPVGQSGSEELFSTAALWEDEEMRRFYEVLPDLREFVPGHVTHTAKPQSDISETVLDSEIAIPAEDDETKEELATMLEVIDEPEETEAPTTASALSTKSMFEAYLTQLPNCINRESIDTAAVDFVMKFNTKFNRKRLTKLLFNVPRIRLDLLPFYARMVANLYPVISEIATDLALLLKHDFKFHIRKKDQINIESKIKNVRFIGELVKFGMYTKIEAMFCVKVLLQDFTHHHIEMCCNLMETCGRFLFRHPDSHQRTKVYLEQMMRNKCALPLDARYSTMIENVFYSVNPPENSAAVRKVRPPMHEFIRRLLYQELNKSNTDKMVRLMRRLNWADPELAAYTCKCLTHAFNVKYYNIPCLANLLAGLAIKEDSVGTQVVDAVLEDIRLGMELNQTQYNQRRIAMIKYIGELYNYRMVESIDIFKVLYLLISFGITQDYNFPSPLDPPGNVIRIRLVCVLLDTCGQYFTNGATKKKLDYFFTFFQNYFLFKKDDPYWSQEQEKFPFGIETIFRESVMSLRPNIHMFADLAESQLAIEKLHEQLILDQPEVYKMEERSLLEDGSQADEESQGEESNNVAGYSMETILEADDENSKDAWSGDEVDQRGEELEDQADGEDQGAEGLEPNVMEEDYLGTQRGIVHIECQEDDDFMASFDRMVSDNLHDRMRETIKPQQVDISVPLHIKSHAKKSYDQLCDNKPQDESTTNFTLMLRKGNKPQYKNLSVPIDSELALNLKDQEEAEKIEKERVKRLTLNINERLEEEDYMEMMAQSPKPMVSNLNRERRPKYQHPRGAPDADLIFGSKRAG